MNITVNNDLIVRISSLWELCPDMRFGQLMATLQFLAEDSGFRNLWDIEDYELLSVVERFRADLAKPDVGAA